MKGFTTLRIATLVVALSAAGTALADDHEDKFKMMDTDGNGSVSRAEHTAFSERGFMTMDANGDGMITKQEMKDGKDKMKDMKKDMKR